MKNSKPRVNVIRYHGMVKHRSDTAKKIKNSGDLLIVKRGRLRTAVMLCPSGCGEEIVINLDARVGPAWSFFNNERGVTLYPSVSRESGCRSHFIVWDTRVFWLDHEWIDVKEIINTRLDSLIKDLLGNKEFVHYSDIAKIVGEIPWAVLLACRRLKRLGALMEGKREREGQFKLRKRLPY